MAVNVPLSNTLLPNASSSGTAGSSRHVSAGQTITVPTYTGLFPPRSLIHRQAVQGSVEESTDVSPLLENVKEAIKECKARVRSIKYKASMSLAARRAYAMSTIDACSATVSAILFVIATNTKSPYSTPLEGDEHYEIQNLRIAVDNWL